MQNPPNRYYLVSFMLFLITVLGVIFFLKPMWDEVNSLSLGRDDILSRKMELQAKLTDLQKVQETLNQDTEVSRETSLAAVPEKLEEDKLIADIVKIARDSDVAMSGISFGISPDSPPGEIAKTSINLSLTGTEGSIINFLRGVEANTRKIVVKTVSVQKASAESGVPLVNFNVAMETYYQGGI